MFGGHNHSHGGGGGAEGHSHANMDPEMRAQMQRNMIAMRTAIMNGQMPQFPPNMPPHMVQRAQEYVRQMQQQMQSQNLDTASFLPPIPMPSTLNGQQLNTDNLIDKDPTCNPIALANCDSQLNTVGGVKEKQERASHVGGIAQEDFSKFDIVKATQHGSLERVKELIESGQAEVNRPDTENVYLLHWAAINNRVEIAKYLLDKGANINAVGGDLESTPLHWAARNGLLKMIILLINNGANPLLFDNEGFSTIHLAAMFGHSNIVAYLLAKGIDVSASTAECFRCFYKS